MADLLVENHVDSVRLDVSRVLPHELQDVLDGGRVGQAAQAHAVPRVGRGQEWGRGHDRHDGRRRQRGDQRRRHVAVQHLERERKRERENGFDVIHVVLLSSPREGEDVMGLM